ncbi:34181_t:CDS:2, partial [Racocetra persica]
KTTLNNQQRKDIIEFKKKNLNISSVDLVSWIKKNMGFDIHPSTIGHLLKNKNSVRDNLSAKRQKTVQYPNLENTLPKAFAQLLNISNINLKFSHGWLFKFKKRYSLNQIIKYDEDVSVDNDIIAATILKLKEILEKYDLKDIYNMNKM